MKKLPTPPPRYVKMLKRLLPATLLPWFDRGHRPMPWRDTRDPYAIWLSEIMLQQTQVATVRPYFERFLRRFPTVFDLAAASPSEVLAQWAGLGYYRRAKYLHLCACTIVNTYNGKYPSDARTLQSLPGIGRYTAGAVASIAFELPQPVLDGNVKRVLARLLALRMDVSTPAAEKLLWQLAEVLVPPLRPGDYNQALMELGATVCLPRNPLCTQCPLGGLCRAKAADLQLAIPTARMRRKPPTLHCMAAVVKRGERLLLLRRQSESLWAGLWETPTLWQASPRTLARAQQYFSELLGCKVELADTRKVIAHQLTHRNIRCHVFIGRLPRGTVLNRRTVPQHKWVRNASDLPVSRLVEKIVDTAKPLFI